ncbi:cutinase family protein [Rhodococcus sp. BP-349]|uniref:cutinase family protein n=1 Tax=unclassified Rhodococcus (in: high G+C Gram-positive bacteria) TaxID=192944 RepID=UPI001C9AB825|nr:MULTISPECIES: cutinase family protein [unclassified Rhodococcus (in: high G+C Gram-positive bacteria)]MBY6537673.1 cutinase family protein [Rhodococcus sp. BP-363]MBY6542010.1 cutinase family protein [Rhodococcus sp. BP-369]MBY6561240.1 cutinase family protein [Rhodococcus sp. BP-370]MBY6575532.1 cutinase family protein [Rhodococcus sp. BP-364]MBY6584833.1 cutinase family protein [Rhodococcus sp. BP-358]
MTPAPHRRTARVAVAGTAVAATLLAAATAHAAPTTTAPAADGCAPLHLVVVPGTTEIDENSSPDADSGFFSRLTVPAMRDANSGAEPALDRSYVPYPASFGGKPGDRSSDTYATSVQTGVDNATTMIGDIAEKCPGTRVFVSGYSQGGQIASEVIREIGAGTGPIDADRFAGGALFSDPTRGQGEPVLGGGDASPAPAPGTDGAAVQSVQLAPAVASTPPAGGGIAPDPAEADFGAVADRVASYCTAGDLACDTPANTPAAKMVANIAGQSSMDTRDPVRILTDVSAAVGRSALLTGASVVNDNLDFDTDRGQFEVTSAHDTVLGKMAKYSDPTTVGDDDDAIDEAVSAVTKIAGMAIGAAITVAKDVITPETIGQLAAVGLTNPPAALAILAAKVGTAAVELVPPATIDSAVNVAFEEVTRTIDDNSGLAQLVTDTSYWNTAVKHGSYDSVPVGTRGETPVQLTVRWIVALAADLTGDSTLADKVGAVLGRSAQLLATPDTVRSAGQILTAGARTAVGAAPTSSRSAATSGTTTTTTPAPPTTAGATPTAAR